MISVQKFGGSSLADAERIRRCAGIIAGAKSAGSDIVAVLSARGDTTDELIAQALELSPEPPARELDVLLSTGELCSAALMAITLRRMGFDCVSLSGRQAGIHTDAEHGEAHISSVHTRRIMRELDAGRIVIVAGFQGVDDKDDVTTLGRGGSDTTAVVLAAALNAGRCEIYSDVDGIYTADPRLVTGAKKLAVIDSGDMLKLAKCGSQVLHSRSVEAAIRFGVPVTLLSSFVNAPGTLMTAIPDRSALPPVTGITRDKALNRISVVGPGVRINCLSEIVGLLCENDIPVLSADCSEELAAVVTDPEHILPAMELIHRQLIGQSFEPPQNPAPH